MAFRKTKAAELPPVSEFRALAAKAEARQLEDSERAALVAVRGAYGACSTVSDYSWYCPVDFDTSALWDCQVACSAFMSLMSRESDLSATAAELVMDASTALSTALSSVQDPMVQAALTIVSGAAQACQALSDASEKTEGRKVAARPVEIRSFRPEARSEGGGSPVIQGYPIRFDALSEPLVCQRGVFRERILPGSVQFAPDVRADFNHDSNYILGRLKNNTLSLSMDSDGVRMACNPPDTQWARDLAAQIERGDIDQGSFSFRVLDGGESWAQEDGVLVRTLSKILVSRVSVVADPAYTSTSIQVRSLDDILAACPPESTRADPQAGQAAPSASGGGVGLDLLRRQLDLIAVEI